MTRVIEAPMTIQEMKMSSAGTTVDLSTSSGNISLGAGDEEEVARPSVDVPSRRNKDQRQMHFCQPDILLT